MSVELVLYQYGGKGTLPSFSPPCLKVYLALRRLDVGHRLVDLSTPLEVRRHSPTGRVPALRIDDRVVTDSCAILDALAQRYPESDLWPRDPQERITDTLWDHFATDTLYWGGFYLRWLVPESRERVFTELYGKGPSLKKVAMRLVAVPMLHLRARGQSIGTRAKDDVARSYRGYLALIDGALAAGPFLFGRQTPGRGDLAVASHLAQLTFAKTSPDIVRLLEDHPRLAPHVRRTFEACDLETP